MKRVLYVLLVANLLWVSASLFGLVVDTDHTERWTQHLLASLLTMLAIAPAALFAASRSSTASQHSSSTPEEETSTVAPVSSASPQDEPSRRDASSRNMEPSEEPVARPSTPLPQTLLRIVGVVLAATVLTSFLALFISVGTSFWTQMLLWSMIGLVVWAPFMVLLPTSRPTAASDAPSPAPADPSDVEPPPFLPSPPWRAPGASPFPNEGEQSKEDQTDTEPEDPPSLSASDFPEAAEWPARSSSNTDMRSPRSRGSKDSSAPNWLQWPDNDS